MSKASLKKELKYFSSEQLSELILNIYSSSKEAKAYLEFFLYPDPEAFVKEKTEAIAKELKRTKRGSLSKARISVIRKYIKEAQDYGLPADYVNRLFFSAISVIVNCEKYIYYPAALFNGTYRLVSDYLNWANKNEMLPTALEDLTVFIMNSESGTPTFRQNIAAVVNSTMHNLKPSDL